MTSIPSSLTRVPNSLVARLQLGSLNQANAQLLGLQQQMSTLQRVNRPSDDPIAAALINTLDTELEMGAQRHRNLTHASGVMGVLDQRLGSMSDLSLEAKSLAASQIGGTSDPVTRANQSVVVDSLINELLASVNSDFAGVSLFAGSQTSSPAVETFRGGFRYLGDAHGLRTDLGDGIDFPITLPADEVVGSTSARVEGDLDLDATLTPGTLLSDLRGPMMGVQELGTLDVVITNGPPVTVQVDLTEAESVGDVVDLIESAIHQASPGAVAAWPGGVTLAGNQIRINAQAGVTVDFLDGPTGTAATALGLAGHTYMTGGLETNITTGAELDPRITDRTTLGSLNPAVGIDFASDITFRNGGSAGTVSITAGMTVGDLKEAVRRLDLGVEIEIDAGGDALNVVNTVAGLRMSVEEAGGQAATTLGIRSLMTRTPISDFNDGRGVEIADGNLDENGLPDPNRNTDFRLTLSDGTTVDIDLTPADMTDVSTVLAAINAQVAGAGVTVGPNPGEFQAVLAPAGNGIRLEDRLGAGALVVESLNGYAAEDLGLLDGTTTTGPAILTGSDRASVRVDSLFSTLVDLRDALQGDDSRGITFAGERLEADVDRLSTARALAGGRTQRLEVETTRLEDRMVLDEQIQSEVRDLDFLEASSRFNLLETQLQAAITVTARTSSLSLINFLR
jgi:flagellar hook-associated protein 3 FlgL